MKKIYSFVFAAVALFAAASCQKELVNAPETKGEPFSFTATIGAETKTALTEDGLNVKWVLGDKVELFDADNKPVVFEAVEIMENGSALFQASSYTVPTDGVVKAVYNNPEKKGAAFIEGSIIGNLHIGGVHTAVAKGYDPSFGILFGKGNVTDGKLSINFNNINSLVKFTIAGDAPKEIVLACNGARSIAGLFAYDFENDKCTQVNPSDGSIYGGSKEITLKPATGESFVSGETYYIPFIAGGNVGNGFSLKFDGTIVIDTKETIENIPHNKIYNLGTVEMPEPSVVTATKVWDAAVPFGGGQDRNMTMDGEYVYVAQAAAGNGAIKAISIADPAIIKDVKVTTHTPAGLDNGTHAISCVRMMPNTDPSVNNGKPVLVASNLTTGDGTEKLIVYIWKDGIDADPDYWCIASGTRRLGDKFTIRGTYQKGELLFWDYGRTDDAVVRVNFKEGEVGLWGTKEDNYATGRYTIPVNPKSEGANSIGEVTIHPDATFDGDGNPNAILATTNIACGFVNQSAGNIYELCAWGTDPDLKQTWGYNFFTHNEKNCIAYVKVANGRTSAALNIIEDINGAADFKGTLEAKKGLLTAPVNGTGEASHGVGDCAVHQTADGATYVAVMAQNIGITLYKLN